MYDRADLIQRTLHTVVHNSGRGRHSGDRRAAAYAGELAGRTDRGLAIPLSMLFATNMMLATGMTASLMSLGAIDFGLIVDSSVIMIENCMRRICAQRRAAGRTAT